MNSQYLTFICFTLLLSSCNDRISLGKEDPFETKRKESFVAPKVTRFTSLADSLQPKL